MRRLHFCPRRGPSLLPLMKGECHVWVPGGRWRIAGPPVWTKRCFNPALEGHRVRIPTRPGLAFRSDEGRRTGPSDRTAHAWTPLVLQRGFLVQCPPPAKLRPGPLPSRKRHLQLPLGLSRVFGAPCARQPRCPRHTPLTHSCGSSQLLTWGLRRTRV
ncbi:hypothetical protein LX36DRAFT_439194 [Colletotrichum falcatum]|nr:hypothetical protein LX36DRAFT_439194 [Colletotrichum falcatum]